MATYIPARGRVALKMDDDTVSEGGIYLPDTARAKDAMATRVGTVVAIGPAKISENGTETACDQKVGDRVTVGKWAGREIKYRGIELTICHFDDIDGVIQDE